MKLFYRIAILCFALTAFFVCGNCFAQQKAKAAPEKTDTANVQTEQNEISTVNLDVVDILQKSGKRVYRLKNRDKIWGERALYVGILNVMLILAILLYPGKDRVSMFLLYFLEGIVLMLSVWMFSATYVLLSLNIAYSALAALAGMASLTAGYGMLVRLNNIFSAKKPAGETIFPEVFNGGKDQKATGREEPSADANNVYKSPANDEMPNVWQSKPETKANKNTFGKK